MVGVALQIGQGVDDLVLFSPDRPTQEVTREPEPTAPRLHVVGAEADADSESRLA